MQIHKYVCTYEHTYICTYIHTYVYTYIHTRTVYVHAHIPTTEILHMVFTKNLYVPSHVNPFNLYLCVISNTDAQQHFLSQVSSAQPTSPRLITLQSDLRLPTALTIYVYPPQYTLLLCCNKRASYFLYVVKRKSISYVFVCLPRCNVVH